MTNPLATAIDKFEDQVAAARAWFDLPRFKGITRLYSPREVAEQQGTIELDYRVAADAAEGCFARLRNLFRKTAANGPGTAVARAPSSLWRLVSLGAPMVTEQEVVIQNALKRVRGEYLEMPGLRLTTAQAQRLWGLDQSMCTALLGALVEAKFLLRTRDGAFVRSDAMLTGRTED
jgi:hypothetical protein